MALLSDVDWMILLIAAAFLLFGPQNAELLRTLGRWYGRAARLKQELLSEFARAADLPAAGGGLSIRGALLGIDEAPSARGVPAAVARPPSLTGSVGPAGPAAAPWSGGYPVATWTATAPVVPSEIEVSR
jgi:hypothetical protein